MVGIIIAIALFFVTFGPLKELKEERKAQVAIIKMFDIEGSRPTQVEQRRELAKSILVVKRHDSSIPGFQDAQLEKQLATIARTGQPLDLQPVDLNRQGRFMSLLFWWTGVMLCLSWLGYGVRYLDLCRRKGYRLWALVPWHRRWAWMVPLRAPWLVLFLISSFLWSLYNAYTEGRNTAKK